MNIKKVIALSGLAVSMLPANTTVVPASIAKQEKVDYSLRARQQNITGPVRLALKIDERGHVKKVDVQDGHPYLVETAVRGVWTWKFQPAQVNGRNVPSEVNLTMRFERASEKQ